MIFLILRVALIAFLFYLIILVVKSLLRPKPNPAPEVPQELVRDALTGVFFDKTKAISLSTDGHTLYFSSPANRDAWLAQKRPLQ
ncbi:MAG: hypothetical protein LBS60_03505 [Deltaproteobacteria bacterium]|jgi:hypothetical protein|nr:hypothetical protein [Deltaproteobacteria bacterium]